MPGSSQLHRTKANKLCYKFIYEKIKLCYIKVIYEKIKLCFMLGASMEINPHLSYKSYSTQESNGKRPTTFLP